MKSPAYGGTLLFLFKIKISKSKSDVWILFLGTYSVVNFCIFPV